MSVTINTNAKQFVLSEEKNDHQQISFVKILIPYFINIEILSIYIYSKNSRSSG